MPPCSSIASPCRIKVLTTACPRQVDYLVVSDLTKFPTAFIPKWVAIALGQAPSHPHPPTPPPPLPPPRLMLLLLLHVIVCSVRQIRPHLF